ncbi:MAG: Fpg/Nei family DNA glycosylase [Ignavibacteriales bacterium]|nr:MAG: Fpg/Nei family DNA glycosylase [Ignavibacteriales bacterium]
MPELPEVESFRLYMDSTSLNKTITGVEVQSSSVLAGVTKNALQKKLKGKKFLSTSGYGKYLFAETNNNEFLVMHFGMTGFLNYYKKRDEGGKYIRMQVNFKNGYHLAFDDRRKLGHIYFTDDLKKFIKKKRLGVDPVRENIGYSDFKKYLTGRRGTVKSVFMNQEIFAGIGNIYSDEILFHSKINPNTSFEKLKEKDLKTLFRKMKDILRLAIDKDAEWGELPENFLLHYRKPGKDCPLCSGTIERSTIGGRSSYYCNKHQRLVK